VILLDTSGPLTALDASQHLHHEHSAIRGGLTIEPLGL
jgi:hypothetical protein